MKTLIHLLFLCLLGQVTSAQPVSVESFVRSYAADHNFNGTVLVQQKGQQLLHQSFGLANREFQVANTNDSKYKIASITKTFTAVLILQLIEAGRLDLTTPISKYLPNYQGGNKDVATVHHLLTHTSGLENCESQGLSIYELPLTVEDIVSKYCSSKALSPPGSEFNYNNGDYILLGKIIEAMYQKPFAEVLKAQILLPLKMDNTNLLHQPQVIPGLSHTYVFNDSLKVFEHDAPFYIENYFAAGGLYSTTTDLLKFSNALFSGKLLKKSTLEMMLRPYPEFYNVAYSVWVTNQTIQGQRCTVAERYGSILGANTLLAHYQERDLTIIIFSNTNATDLGRFKEGIAELLIK